MNVFTGADVLDLNWYHDEDDEVEDDEVEDEDGGQAMELEPSLIAELAGWLRGVRFEDVYDGPDDYGLIRGDFEEFRTFILAVAERGEGALLHIS